jgi:hypothetical protein
MASESSEIKLEGFDWSELAPVFGVAPYDIGADNDEKRLAANIRDGIQEIRTAICFKREMTDAQVEQIAQTRAFVSLLALCDHTYDTPLWRGLAGIYDDETFLGYVQLLLEAMWN